MGPGSVLTSQLRYSDVFCLFCLLCSLKKKSKPQVALRKYYLAFNEECLVFWQADDGNSVFKCGIHHVRKMQMSLGQVSSLGHGMLS